MPAVIKHYAIIAGAVVAVAVPTVYFRAIVHELNLSNAYQGVVTLTTGAMIALFLAVFYSNQQGVNFLRAQSQSRLLCYYILIDLASIVLSGALIGSNLPHKLVFEAAATAIIVVLMVDLTWWNIRLVNLGLG